ncbi:MAG TPA: TNT domain-containing protein [Pseudonocardiaceae bacterium]|nr:TNT domain-containing protein [Pseudonocardiaceae bacterium]
MRTAPDDWHQINAEFRATGRYYELSADVTDSDGSRNAWTASHDIAMHFAKLRAGMYREGRGTWFNARYQIEKPSSYNLEFDRQEPTWRTPPPVAAFRDELHFFPRTEENVPDWLLRKLSGLPPERPGRRFRLARIFDGTAPNGRPSVNRPSVSDDDRDRLLEYLDHSALALPERGHDVDRLSSDGRPTVPVAFHTDGVWVWPAAVNYYLRRYGVPPDPELVNHARSNGFRPPEVDDQTIAAAAATITGGRPPGPPRPGGPGGPGAPGGPPPGGPPPGGPAGPGPGAPGPAGPGRQGPPPGAVTPPIPAAVAAAGPGAMDLLRGQPQQQAGPPPAVPQQLAAQLDDAPGGAHSAIEDDDHDEPHELPELDQHDRLDGRHDLHDADEPAPPVAPPPVRSGSQQERTLNLLNQRLADLRVPESAYRIGEPAPQTWYLEQVDDGWQVGWFDGEFSSPMLFEEVADASAFLLGKLLLGVPAESALHDPAPAPPAHQMVTHDDEDEPVDLAGVDEDDEHQHAKPSAHELTMEPPPQHAMEPPQHAMDSPLDHVEDDELEQPEAAHEMAREPQHDMARDLPQRDLGQHDLGQRDLGQHDLGQHDLGQHDLGQHDLGQRDLPQREMAQQNLARDMLPVPPPVAEPPHPDLAEPVPAMNNHVNNRVQESVAPPPMQQQPAQQQQQPMQQSPMQNQMQQGQQGPPPEWPIQPLAGEPPLTLFRGKRLLELQPGTEVDRFGSPEGNLTYVAGTPFEQRSLVPDWVHRPYHMYRVTRPVQALTGGAIPWFDQPGGGTAYLLPRAIDELVGTGELVEIEPAEPPVS